MKTLTWAAYKATHISHLGDGVYWNDVLERDFYDAYKTDKEDRRVDNDLPQLDTLEDLVAAFVFPVFQNSMVLLSSRCGRGDTL